MLKIKSLVATGALIAAGLAASTARADDTGPCGNGSSPNPVYVSGSTAIAPFIAAMGAPLYQDGAMTLVYQKQGSCVGVAEIVNDATPAGACTTGACITGTGTYYDGTGLAHECDLDAAGQHVDVGVSDVFATSCSGITTVPADVKDTFGPIQAMLFVISKANPTPQQAITAEEGYFVFGFGGAAGMVSPWTNVALQFIRNSGSGTQTMTTTAIGIPPDKMKGVDSGGSGGVLSMVGAQTDTSAIGILGADLYDLHRDTLQVLAFKAYGQWFGYYPDSSPTSFDKQNVRDGHYYIWGPVHMLAHTDGNGDALNPLAQTFLDYVQGKPATPAAPFDITTIAIDAHVVPDCAMKVQRSTEVGPLSAYAPDEPCGCYFESKVGTSTCTACNLDDGQACSGGGVCRHHFCEAQ
jgi:ABC-type phosphate transport system substrate-binding protein